jgi:hypothetical protein
MCRPVPRQSRFTVVWYFLCNRNRSRNLEQGYGSGSSWVKIKIIRFRRFRFRNTDTMIIKYKIVDFWYIYKKYRAKNCQLHKTSRSLFCWSYNFVWNVDIIVYPCCFVWYFCLWRFSFIMLKILKKYYCNKEINNKNTCFISWCCYECGILDFVAYLIYSKLFKN